MARKVHGSIFKGGLERLRNLPTKTVLSAGFHRFDSTCLKKKKDVEDVYKRSPIHGVIPINWSASQYALAVNIKWLARYFY